MKMSDNERMTMMEMMRNHLLHERGQWYQCTIILSALLLFLRLYIIALYFMLLYLVLTTPSFYLSFQYEKIRSWEFLRHEIKIIKLIGHELEVRMLWTSASLLLKMKTHYRNKMGSRIAQNCLWLEVEESVSPTPCLCHHICYSVCYVMWNFWT